MSILSAKASGTTGADYGVARYAAPSPNITNSKTFSSSLGAMSNGEVILFRFFEMVWSHINTGFDIAEAAAVLEDKNCLLAGGLILAVAI